MIGEKPSLRVLLVQMTSVDSVKTNLEQIHKSLKNVTNLSSFDLISLPENALHFYLSRRKKSFSTLTLTDPAFIELQSYCDKFDLCLHVGSVPLKVEKGIANATIWMSPQKKPQCAYQKIHLFDVEIKGQTPLRESDQFIHGSHPSTVNLKGWKIGLSICYDLRFSELYNYYAKCGVDALLVPSAFTLSTGKAHWHCLLKARAIESQCFVLAAAQSGQHSTSQRVSFGHSLAYAPWGQNLGEIKEEGPGVLSVEMNPQLLIEARRQIPMSQHRKL